MKTPSRKYTLSLMDSKTLERKWHIQLTPTGVIVTFGLSFLLLLALFSVLIIYTPVRRLLPGNNERVREQLIVESQRVDSLLTETQLGRQYLDVLKQVIAGEIAPDSLAFDSVQQVEMRQQLLEAKNAATEEFLLQYEQKERDHRFALFEIQQHSPVITFFRPARGAIVRPYAPGVGQYGVDIAVASDENVTAVLGGTIIHQRLEINNTYTLVLLHDGYVSIYQHIGRCLKRLGTQVEAGESIAIVSADLPLHFELWKEGCSLNPEEVIAF